MKAKRAKVYVEGVGDGGVLWENGKRTCVWWVEVGAKEEEKKRDFWETK